MATIPGTAGADTLTGTAQDDTITGLGGSDTLYGGGSNDLLDGGTGDDRLYGGTGIDVLSGGAGSDLLDGGTGTDTASYSSDTAAISANLGAATATVTGGSGGTDTLVSIENIIGTAFNDSIVGSTGDNLLAGGLGSDTIFGGLGNDTIYTGNTGTLASGTGTDTIDAGDGNDLIYVTELANSASTIDGGAGTDTIVFDYNPATLSGTTLRITMAEPGLLTQPLDGILGDQFFRNVENVTTGAGTDSVVGNSVANVLTSQGGNDTVDGAGGNDTLFGGDGDDRLLGGTGDDSVDAGTGNDTLIGGAGADLLTGDVGVDLADYSGSTAAVNVDLTLAGAQAGGDAAGDTVSGVENLTGSDFNDTLTGDTAANVLTGGLRNDILSGGAGNDTLLAGTGDDTLNGGAGADVLTGDVGIDVADYSGSTTAVNVNLTLAGAQTGGDAAGDTISGVENLTGSDFNDTLTGDTAANFLTGGLGNDSLSGGAGIDTLYGGSSDDTLIGGGSADVLYGGAGIDQADYSGSGTAVNVNLTLAGAQTGGDAAGDTLSGVENLTGSDFNDTLTGDTAANILTGGLGNDSLSGGAGIDTLYGGSSDDTLIGGGSADLLYGGAGTDLVDYSGSGVAVNVNLAVTGTQTGGDAADDTLSGVENLTGSDFNDTLTGDGGTNILTGGLGNDSLSGGAGIDTLYGGSADDTLIGDGSADLLYGGAGTDLADYSSSGTAVNVNLTNVGGQTGGDAAGDTISGVENLTGSDFNDTLTGDGGSNVLTGGLGIDSLAGGAGTDTLYGGSGDDTLVGGSGADILYGGLGNDLLDGGADVDALFGGVGNDTIVASGQGETLFGGDDRDTLRVLGVGSDTILGGEGGNDEDVLDFSAITGPRKIVFDGASTQSDLSGTVTFYDPNNPTVVTGTLVFDEIEGIICFTPGTLIDTRQGPVPVEHLREGDWMATRDNGYQQIRWVGRRDLSRAQVAQDPSLAPILIKAGSLGDGLPDRDMMVSPVHRMLVMSRRAQLYFEEPEVLISARLLTQISGVIQLPATDVSYIHFMFDHHQIVRANGSWTESFLPGDGALKAVDREQRGELFKLFPDLADLKASGFEAARRVLKRHEADVLLAH